MSFTRATLVKLNIHNSTAEDRGGVYRKPAMISNSQSEDFSTATLLLGCSLQILHHIDLMQRRTLPLLKERR